MPPWTSQWIASLKDMPLWISQWIASLKRAFSWGNSPLEKIRADWVSPNPKTPWLAGRLFELTRDSANELSVDDRTWSDLEFDRLFSLADSTRSPLGSQCLYRRLRTYVGDESALEGEYEIYVKLANEAHLRETIQLATSLLQNDSNALICDALFGREPRQPLWAPLIFLFSGLSLLSCVVAIFVHSVAWVFAALVSCNVILLFFGNYRFHDVYSTAGRIGNMIGVAVRLSRIESSVRFSQIETLRHLLSDNIEIKRAFRWFLLKRDETLLGSLAFYLQLLFLVDLAAGAIAIARMRRLRRPLQAIFEAIGSVEATVSVASWISRVPTHCHPKISGEPRIEIVDGYHPMISGAVTNSICLAARSALIVGSNMAGKTTFIKMIGTNIVLGRTLGICFASSAVIPRSPVMASIRSEHSIESGKSHFFSEIERILLFLKTAEESGRGVFLIDELFRGTNTPERIAAAKAVLEEMARHAQVLATTHDVELQAHLQQQYSIYHFTENPDLAEVFDYKLRAGISHARNAIKLLERIGFSESIIREAQRLLDENRLSDGGP
jgi:MutS domain V